MLRGLPIYINNRNRLTSLQALISWLDKAGHDNITIIDNASTYEPLLEFYEISGIRVKRLANNLGPYALWCPECSNLLRIDPFIYTDSDIVPHEECPKDAVEVMLGQVAQLQGRFKVGFGLKIDDIPDSYAQADRVRWWESRFWDKPAGRQCKAPLYLAKIDTTFAVYPARSGFFTNALRTGGRYIARHMPWYVDSANPGEEETFIERHSQKSFVSWGVSECHSKRVTLEERLLKKPAERAQPKSVPNPNGPEWEQLPMHVDMSCYAQWYQSIVQNEEIVKAAPVIVEAGTRYGCSARIIADALKERAEWQLYLVDPIPTKEARQVVIKYPKHVTFLKMRGERAATKFQSKQVDLLHIDADVDNTHPYEMALDILLSFWNRLKPDASVILHDCTDHFPGIRRLARELEQSGQWTADYAKPQPACPISAPALLKKQAIKPLDASLSVVVPIIGDKWLRGFLQCLQNQTVPAQEIIVIDNSGEEIGRSVCETFAELPIRYLPQSQNLGVNASWNLGVAESSSSFVSILNDDILIPDEFVEAILQTFDQYRNVGLIVPQTQASRSGVKFEDIPFVVRRLTQREGWAFSVRKDAWEPIPPQFFTFCGDDFAFRSIQAAGFWAVSNANIQIWHAVGISADKAERKRLGLPAFEQERSDWQKYCKEHGW